MSEDELEKYKEAQTSKIEYPYCVLNEQKIIERMNTDAKKIGVYGTMYFDNVILNFKKGNAEAKLCVDAERIANAG